MVVRTQHRDTIGASKDILHAARTSENIYGHETVNTKVFSVAGSIPTGGKLFAEINLPFTTKQYNDNIASFVYDGETRMANQMWSPKAHYTIFAIVFCSHM